MKGSDRPGDRAAPEVCLLARAAGVVAIRKPAGLATQAPVGIDSAESRVRSILYGGPTEDYLGVPHRLDRVVSGVMLFAETPRAARKLSRQFERRQIVKRYRALVLPTNSARSIDGPAGRLLNGSLPYVTDDVPGAEHPRNPDGFTPGNSPGGLFPESGFPDVGEEWQEWHDWLAKRRGVAMVAVVDRERKPLDAEAEALDPPREALTRVRLAGLQVPSRITVGEAGRHAGLLELELEPVTGRMHQIRVQAASRGLPVLGDIAYGCPLPYAAHLAHDPRFAPIALHAASITYLDPDSGRPITITCDPPWRSDADRADGR